jgi:hypothetical protein
MQALAGSFLLLAGVYQVVASFLAWPLIQEAALRSIQSRHLAPQQEQQVAALGAGVGVAVGVAVGGVLLLLGILSLARRQAWVFYADLVVFAAASGGVVTGIAGLMAGEGPGAFFQLLVGLVAAALFIWMLSARIDVGPWACRKAPTRP